MGFLEAIAQGFGAALTWENLGLAAFGVLIGTVVGLLPGLGGAAGMTLLLPLTLNFDVLGALILLSGIYYGVQYGGSITAILIATPGSGGTVMTTFEGYPLARQGRAGPAIAIAAIASFVAGTITTILLMAFTPVLATVAIEFGPPEMLAIIIFALVSIANFSSQDRLKSFAMAGFGLTLATIGLDPQTGLARLTFGSINLLDGIGFIAVVIGLFAVTEVMLQVGRGGAEPIKTRLRDMVVSREDWRVSRFAILRGTALGFFIGVLPGAGPMLGSYFGYDLERRVSKHPERFGKGAMEGLAAPEAANNAAAGGSFVPLLTLGVPGSTGTAILLGAFLVFGIRPGPFLLDEQGPLVWALLASFYIGNALLLILNLPLAPLFASLLRFRYSFIYPPILFVSFVGAFGAQNRVWSMWIALAFALVGYLMHLGGFPAAPLVLALILGGVFERSLGQTSAMGGGDLTIVFSRPVSGTLMLLSVLILVGPGLWRMARRRLGSSADG